MIQIDKQNRQIKKQEKCTQIGKRSVIHFLCEDL